MARIDVASEQCRSHTVLHGIRSRGLIATPCFSSDTSHWPAITTCACGNEAADRERIALSHRRDLWSLMRIKYRGAIGLTSRQFSGCAVSGTAKRSVISGSILAAHSGAVIPTCAPMVPR